MQQDENNSLMIVHDLDETQAGTNFDIWPLHITILFYFTYDRIDEATVLECVRRITHKTGPIAVFAGSHALYGSRHDIPVTKLNDPTGKLVLLQTRLLNGLIELGCKLTDTIYTSPNYSPHVSHIGTRTGPESDYAIRHISVIKNSPKDSGWTKTVLAKYTL